MNCPRCTGQLYRNGDIYGDYFQCLSCGFHKDDEAPDYMDASDRLPYVGLNIKWSNLVTSYTETLSNTHHQIIKIISCPFSKNNNNLCRQDMKKTGRMITRSVRQGNGVEQKKMHEWQCPGGHSIGISRGGFTSWA